MTRKVLMQGNEAVVEGAIKGGMRFFAGYPITPSTEIAEMAALKLPRVGGRFIQMEDEIASMAAILGASAVGTKTMTATSGPGFSLKQENLGYGCILQSLQMQRSTLFGRRYSPQVILQIVKIQILTYDDNNL